MSGRALRWLLSLGIAPRDPHAGPPRLTIVRHHRVYGGDERPLYRLGVGEAVLAGQLRACADAGLAPVTVGEGLARLARGEGGRQVAFSFDDGYADNVERALPLLARHGARATFFLTAGLMDERRAPWWDELAWVLERARTRVARVPLGGRSWTLETATPGGRAAALAALLPRLRVPPAEQRARLDALRAALAVPEPAPCALADWAAARRLVDAGMEVGAHTLTHPFLSLLPADAQAREIAGSAALIRARLGAEPGGLAYPNGDHDARCVEAARAAGFAWAVTTAAGDVGAGADAMRLPRRGLGEGACLAPGGRFSARMTLAELAGAFDALRPRPAGAP